MGSKVILPRRSDFEPVVLSQCLGLQLQGSKKNVWAEHFFIYFSNLVVGLQFEPN